MGFPGPKGAAVRSASQSAGFKLQAAELRLCRVCVCVRDHMWPLFFPPSAG